MHCTICGRPAPADHDELTSTWVPYYYEGDQEVEGPVCPRCTRACLRVGRDGEWERKPRPTFSSN